jgi:hypothetical protein
MRPSDQLLERAVRLSALARRTREEGHLRFAKELGRLAAESYEKAAKSTVIRKETTEKAGNRDPVAATARPSTPKV